MQRINFCIYHSVLNLNLNLDYLFEIIFFENNPLYGILHSQFSIDRDSCSDTVGYFYAVVPGQMYKNWQGKLAQLLIYTGLEAHLLVGCISYITV